MSARNPLDDVAQLKLPYAPMKAALRAFGAVLQLTLA
jgi:hypothetical protein